MNNQEYFLVYILPYLILLPLVVYWARRPRARAGLGLVLLAFAIASVLGYPRTNLYLYTFFLGPLVFYWARSPRARAGLGLALLVGVVGCNHQLPTILYDHVQFERRKAAEGGGVRVFERIPPPEGIVVNGRFDVCAALLPRKIISYCDVADGKGVQRYRMLEGHAACTGARAAFERSTAGREFFFGRIPNIAFDLCMSEEKRAVSDAPVQLRLLHIDSYGTGTPEPGMPVFASTLWTIRRGEVLARDPAAPRRLASAEAVDVWIPILPVLFRPSIGHGGGGFDIETHQWSYGQHDIARILLKELFGVTADDPVPEPADAIQRLVGNLGEGKHLRRIVAEALAARLAWNRGDGSPPLDPAWLPTILRAAETELSEERAERASTGTVNALINLIGAYGPQAKAAKPLVMAALDRPDLQSHALRAGLAAGLFDQGDVAKLEVIAERGEESARRVAEEALQALEAASPQSPQRDRGR